MFTSKRVQEKKKLVDGINLKTTNRPFDRYKNWFENVADKLNWMEWNGTIRYGVHFEFP